MNGRGVRPARKHRQYYGAIDSASSLCHFEELRWSPASSSCAKSFAAVSERRRTSLQDGDANIMTKTQSLLMMVLAAGPAALGGLALAAQDRYTLQVPGGLAFAEFRGYEDWQVIAASHNG